jgi:group I intron endonuclease
MLAYMGTNTKTGQRYVGVTSQRFRTRLNEHRSSALTGSTNLLHQAIREHGWDAFEWEQIAECDDRDLLLLIEREAVDKFKTHRDAGGYNMTSGGAGVAGFRYSEESRRKLSEALKNRPPRSEETRRKLSAANKGKRPSPQTIASVSKPKSAETKAKMSASMKGRKPAPITDETRAKLRAAWVRRKVEGDRLMKIPRSDLPTLLARRAAGESFRAIAKTYGCSPSAVFLFVKGAV